jgi:hypothetical protein
MHEVRAAKQNCPPDYVPSPVEGVPPLRYRFAPAPDQTWPTTHGVDRFAVAAAVNDQQGHHDEEEAIYQQHGRLLAILYVSDPKTNATVLTRSIEALSETIARRMTALPANAVM